MSYIKPKGTLIELVEVTFKDEKIIKEKKYFRLLFTLGLIDELQDKTKMPMDEIVLMMINKNKSPKNTIQCILKHMFEQEIELEEDKLEYYGITILKAYIDQLKFKKIPGQQIEQSTKDGYEFIDTEYWFYIGTVELKRSDEKVLNMTLGTLRTLHNEHAKYSGWIKEDKEQSLLGL